MASEPIIPDQSEISRRGVRGAASAAAATELVSATVPLQLHTAGGIAGHYAGHQALLAAAAGCLAGRHLAKKDAEAAQHNSTAQTVKPY